MAVALVLQALAGCRPASRIYSIQSATLTSSIGNTIVFTTFAEVPDTDDCHVATNATDKGIREGSPQGTTSDRQSLCVSELPAELQAVANGERLPGAYIVKTSWPDGPPGFLVARGFPIDRPEMVCQDLLERIKGRMRSDNATLTCQHPAEVSIAQAD